MQSKSLKRFFVLIFFSISIFCFTKKTTYTFGGESHEGITTDSLRLVSKLTDSKKATKDDFSKFYGKGYWQVLEEYSVKPDEDENDGANKYHFNNWITNRNFTNKKGDATAKNKFIEHFKKAVKLYKENYIVEAYQELGRAIHYLQDMNTPVHTVYENIADAGLWLPTHIEFENICDKIRKTCKAKIYKENLEFYEVNSLGAIADSSCMLSANNFSLLYGNVCSVIHKAALKSHSVEEIAENAIINAQRNTVGVLYRFYKEVHNDVNTSSLVEKTCNNTDDIENLSNEKDPDNVKQIIERGRLYYNNMICSERFEFLPEQAIDKNSFKKDVLIKKEVFHVDEKGNLKKEIDCVKKFTFTYDKKSFVRLLTPKNSEEAVLTEKISEKKSNWNIADTSKIIPSKNFCLVSSVYTIFEKSDIDVCHVTTLQDLHTDVFCSKYGNIGINSDN